MFNVLSITKFSLYIKKCSSHTKKVQHHILEIKFTVYCKNYKKLKCEIIKNKKKENPKSV